MKNLTSFAALGEALAGAVGRLEVTLQAVATASAEMVEAEAKSEFGTYQRSNMGPFRSWEELAASTKERRLQEGFAENDPLLKTGELRESITHSVGPASFAVGSESKVMLWQELGVDKTNLPPRPVLQTALFRMTGNIQEVLGWSVKTTLEGGL